MLWIATSDTTNWLQSIYRNKAPSRQKTPVYGLVDFTTNFPTTPRRMGLGRLLLTTTTHTTTVFMGGKNHIRIFLQCNRAEEATMSFYTSNGFTVLTEKLDSAKEDEPESDERCHFQQVEDKKGNHLQSSHWRFGFVSIPCDIRDQMEESYPNMWLSSSGTATFDLLVLDGPPYRLSKRNDDVWASFPIGVPFGENIEGNVFTAQPTMLSTCLYKRGDLKVFLKATSEDDDSSVTPLQEVYSYSRLLTTYLTRATRKISNTAGCSMTRSSISSVLG